MRAGEAVQAFFFAGSSAGPALIACYEQPQLNRAPATPGIPQTESGGMD